MASLTADQIERQMEQNSADWHKTADQAEKDKLHQTNVALAAQRDALTGGGSTFDSSSGTWDLSRMGTGSAAYTASSLPGTSSYSGYITQVQSAKEAAAIAALDGAYQQNVLEMDRAQAQVAPVYQAARNQTAASAAQSRKNFHEYAAASGLNSGTAGQSELAQGIALQSNLTSLNSEEAGALSDIEFQRSKLAAEYNSAIASAKAAGQSELAQMLYQEMVRMDEVTRETAYQQAGLDYQAYQTNYNARRDAAADAETARQWEYTHNRDSVDDGRYANETAYARERDTVQDGRYANETAYQRQQDSIAWAMERWAALGYLDGESAAILGIPAGTSTSDQRYRAAQIAHMK